MFDKFKSYSIKKTTDDIKQFKDSTFTQDVKQQAMLVNQEIRNAVNTLRFIGLSADKVAHSNDSGLKSNLDLKYDAKEKLYKYFDESSVRVINKEKFGFIVNCWSNSSSKINPGTLRQVNKFSVLKSQLMEPFNDHNNSIVAAFILGKDKFLVDYTRQPEINSGFFNNVFFEKTVDSIFRHNYGEEKIIFSNVFKDRQGKLIISILTPVRDSNNRVCCIAGVILSYKKIISQLYSVFSNLDYKNYHVIRLFINDKGNIIHLSPEYYDLFSLAPEEQQSHTSLEQGIYRGNLLHSTDPVIRSLTELILTRHFEETKVKIKGKNYLLIFQTLSQNNWKMAVLIRTSELYGPLHKALDTFQRITAQMYSRYIINFLVILILGLFVSFMLFKYIFIKPIEYLRNKVEVLGKGDFNLKIKEAGIREIYDLSKTFNMIGCQLKEYVANLAKEVQSRQAIETEVKIAGELQQSVLPKISYEFERNEFELYANLIPAKEMSGDFYDFFFVKKDLLAIVLADVSGKGITAAFYMSMAKAIIKDACLALKTPDPGKILESVNSILCKDNDTAMFLTMYLVFYDISSGRIIYANAGHHEFIKVDNNGKVTTSGISRTTAIGVFDETQYKNAELQLRSGEIFALYTDGIIEAPDKSYVEFGTERLVQLFETGYKNSLANLGDSILKEVLDFQKGDKFDDITLLMLKNRYNQGD